MRFDLKYWLRDYFGFSKKEINGFFVLSFLLILLLIAPWFYSWFTSPAELSSQDQRQLDSLLSSLPQPAQSYQDDARKSYPSKKREENKVKELFRFDPNTVTEAELNRLGFSAYLTRNFLKYRSKGVKFYRSAQLKKIYGMDDDFFVQIEPYMTFPKRSKKQWSNDNDDDQDKTEDRKYTQEEYKYSPKAIQPFDINQADTSTLKQIKGIGTVLSQRIVNFRDKLGGFTEIQQVKKVYGLSPEVAEELLKYAYLPDNITVKKLNINQASFEVLEKHPLISKGQANAIYQYRKQHGSFQSLEDLKKIRALNEELIQKLAPYLYFE